MRAVVQRVKKASVTVDDKLVGQIDKGLIILLGVGKEDNESDINYLVEKIANLRTFEDAEGKMNLSILDVNGDFLVVSQFTLYGDCRKGRRPSYTESADPEIANMYYEKFVEKLKTYGRKVETGIFGADMLVEIHNDGPVTLLLDSKKVF